MELSNAGFEWTVWRSRQWWARLWNAALAVVVALSLLVQLWLLLSGGADANSGRTEPQLDLTERLIRMFSYFTIQSNIFVLVVTITLLMNPARDGRLWRVVRFDALLGIVITGLVFGTVLAKIVHLTGLAFLATVGFHYVAPSMTLLGWLLFGPRPRIGWSTVGLSFIWPILWIVYTFAHGAASRWYPYPFLNPDKIGYPSALGNTALIFIGAGLLALALKALDDWLPTS